MADESPGQLKFVCLRDEGVLRLHMYTVGGTLMSTLESPDPQALKALTVAWLQNHALPYDEGELAAAIGRAGKEARP